MFGEASIWSITIQLALPLLSTQAVRLGGWISGGSSCYQRVAGCLQQVCEMLLVPLAVEKIFLPVCSASPRNTVGPSARCFPVIMEMEFMAWNFKLTAHAGRPGILYPSPKSHLAPYIWSFVCCSFCLVRSFQLSNRPSM